MQELRAQAGERQKKIDTLVQDIQSKLTEKQKEKFKTVMTPNLQEMARAERGQFRGRGERREQ
jgi:predicted site-specific integrase-resolvase